MTREQVIERTKMMIAESNKKMLENLEKLIDSGNVDYQKAEDNNLLPRMIICALHKEEAFQYKPLDKKAQKEVNYIYNSIF